MRPILLEITGLHSFRERRVVDFEPLLRDHLFGIFGPTGGGKSTILDAMTLALFGKIERTKGAEVASAINAREAGCAVAFTFAVRTDGGERRYRVERTYKRQKSGTIKSEARLVDLSADPPLPLADKTSEVSGRVEELLGIRQEDFRLSVVLPQGAFAEFLHLPQKKRGEMLQRIFGLEELGNRINGRLQELRAQLASARTGLEARLDSLKGYDDATLKERRAELERAERTAEESRTHAAETERQRNEGETLHDLVSERERMREGEEKRKKDRERLERLRTALQRSQEAAGLEPLVEGARRGAESLGETIDACGRAERERARAEEELAPLRERKTRAEREKGEGGKVPLLEEQIRGLEGLAEIDERIRPLLRSVAERERKIAANEILLAEALKTVERNKEAEARGKEELEEMKKGKQAIEADVRKLEQQLSGVERLLPTARRREEESAQLEALLRDERERSRELAALRTEIEAARTGEARKSAELEEARTRYEEARVGNVLGQALPLLHDGEPCPLCGATDHPHPYSHAALHDLSSLSSAVKAAEKNLADLTGRLRELEKRETALAAQQEEKEGRQRELREAYRQRTAEIEQTIAETGYKGEADSATLRGWQEKISGRLARKKEEEETAEEKIEALETAMKKGAEAATAANGEAIRLGQTLESGKEERKREERELEEIRTRRRERLRLIGIEAAEGESRNVLSERKEELNRLKKKIEEIEAAFEKGQSALHNAEKECHRLLALKEREERELEQRENERDERLKEKGFESVEAWKRAALDADERERLQSEEESLADELNAAERYLKELEEKIGGREITGPELEQIRTLHAGALRQREEALTALGKAEQAAAECEARNAEWKEVMEQNERTAREFGAMRKLSGYLQGNAFINFLADERLQQICRTASGQLRELTGGRLEIGSRSDEGFFIRDNGNAGAERPPGSLSGGETFLVSLALSLALSDSLQVGRSPMEFFFLDEGFGTLDDDLLETVLDSLERLRATSHRAIGVISHVPQLRERIARRLIVTAATEAHGTDVRLEVS